MFEHGDGIARQKRLMQSTRGHCRAENPSHPLPQFRSHATHKISRTLQNLHVESCVDSFTLRCEFVVHNCMALHCTNFLYKLRTYTHTYAYVNVCVMHIFRHGCSRTATRHPAVNSSLSTTVLQTCS